MGSKAELGTMLNGLKQRTRKKKNAGEGKDFRREGEVYGARAAYGESGGGAVSSAQGRRRDNDRKYMQRKVSEKREVMSNPQKKAEQKGKNLESLRGITRELMYKEGPDYGTISDFAQGYVPIDDRLGKASRKQKNKAAAKKYYSK